MVTHRVIRSIAISFLLCSGFAMKGQSDIVRTGLVSAMATISPSTMLSGNGQYFYLHGDLNVYLNEKVSVGGETYFFAGNISGPSLFAYNHKVFFGTAIHKATGRNDLYLAFHPGVSFTKLKPETFSWMDMQTGINPILSVSVGDNFFISDYFHFFVQVKLLLGEHNYDIHQNLSELLLSAGLGFNINALGN